MLYRVSGNSKGASWTRDIITRDGFVVRVPDGWQWAQGKSINVLLEWCREHKMKIRLVDARTV